MLDPAAPNVKKGSRSAAKSRAVNRGLTRDQYGIWPGRATGPAAFISTLVDSIAITNIDGAKSGARIRILWHAGKKSGSR